MSVEGASQ